MNSESPRARLVFPPQWSAQNPHYALRGIAGHLRSRGIETTVRDLNVEYYDYILSYEYLEMIRSRLNILDRYIGTQLALARQLGSASRKLLLDVQRHRLFQRWNADHPGVLDAVVDQIEEAKAAIRDRSKFYEPATLLQAMALVDRALEAISFVFFPAQIGLNFFELHGAEWTIESMLANSQDRELNPFYDWFEEQVPSLLEGSPHYIGISINAFSQVLPGLTLARLLKQAAPPGVHIGIGGNFFHRVRDVLAERPQFFEAFADSVAYGEGEYTLQLLVEALARGADLNEVPNLLVQTKDGIVRTPERTPPPMDAVGKQDLAGLPLDKYLTPELVLTIRAGKGCYWARCTFCDSYVGVKPDSKALDGVIEEIKYLRDTFGVRNFQFIDEAISPTRMRAMAERFIAEDLDITWFCNGRLENRFTADLLQLLARSGLKMILWGFESGSPRIFKLIRKGVAFEKRLEILKDATDAGIWNFAYIFFGFPTETWQDAMATIDIICENTNVIHSYGRSVFTLGKHSPLFAERDKLGLVEVIEDKEELSSNLYYRDTQGMPEDQLKDAMKLCTSRCSEAYQMGLWFFLRYRENIHLYLSRYGPQWLRDFHLVTTAVPTKQYF